MAKRRTKRETRVRPWLRKLALGCASLAAAGLLVILLVGGVFLVQRLSERAEETRLAQKLPSADLAAPFDRPGRVVLSLSSAAVTVDAGPPGAPIRVESSFDPDVFRLEQAYEEDADGGWTYRVDFHEKRTFHVSVVQIWIGRKSPEVRVSLPRGLALDLEAKMRGGYLSLDLAGLALRTASVELDRGVLQLEASEPLALPMERLDVKGRIGTTRLSSLGNASPAKLNVRHGIGAALVDLDGAWVADANVRFEVAFGDGILELPDGVNVELLDLDRPPIFHSGEEEVPAPTLRVSTHFDMGDIRVVE